MAGAMAEAVAMEASVSEVPVADAGDAAAAAATTAAPIDVSYAAQGAEAQSYAAQATTAAATEPEPTQLSEYDQYWNVVKANPADFNTWTQLIAVAERTGELEKIRAVFDAFFVDYPLCYGYWKKYADHELHLGAPDTSVGLARAVYERAVVAVAHSVDIWTHYCTFLLEKSENQDEIRSAFEKAAEVIGTDYVSHMFWDKYLEYVFSTQDYRRAAAVYTQILHIPLQQLDRYWTSLKQFATSRPLEELQTAEEVAEAATAAAEVAPFEATAELTADNSEVADGEAAADGAIASSAKPSELTDKDKWLAVREAIYLATKQEDANIRDFELAIKRPYFHVKPLDDMQLLNWHRYIDSKEQSANNTKVTKLYERCLVACANYPEFWIRYVSWLDKNVTADGAREALSRATDTFVKRKTEAHLFAARFEEQHGNIDVARQHYAHLLSMVAPGLLKAIVASANMERRQGDMPAARRVYEAALDGEQSKEDSKLLPLLCVQYMRFLDQAISDVDRAREIYTLALEKASSSRLVWEAAVALEIRHKDSARAVALYERALSDDAGNKLSMSDREDLSVQCLEFLDLQGDQAALAAAEERHNKLFPPQSARPPESRKRPGDASGEPNKKAQRTNAPAGYAPAANGHAASSGYQYGAQAGYQQPYGQYAAPYAAPQQPAYAGYGYAAGYGAAPAQQAYAAPQAYAYGQSQPYAQTAAYTGSYSAPQSQAYYQGYYQQQ
eukprot:jgi/Chlat1/6357/Chrsp44S05821